MKFVYFVSGLLLMFALSADASAQTTFTNSTLISVPDGLASPYPSNLPVSGLSGTITDIDVRINGFTHTFPDDVAILLVSPDGRKFILQSDVGGGTDISAVTYTLDDQATAVIPNAGPFPATGTSVRPSSVGDDDEMPAPAPPYPYNQPAPAGSATLNGTFGGANPNGIWKLFIVDFFAGDEGLISGGYSLIITTSGGGGTPTPTPDAPVDFNGDGKTDYAVYRNITTAINGQLRWFYNINGSNAPTVALDWGLATDTVITEDFDGDLKDDVAVWRPGAPTVAAFYILNSATNTARVEAFGQNGDDASVVGDYNGDNRADLAVYRSGANAGAQSIWFYRSAPNGPTIFTPWGLGGDFPIPGDYDGDGRNDFVVQRGTGTGNKGIVYTRLATGVNLTPQPYGQIVDLLVPGDYDGDGKTDLASARAAANGALEWYWRRSSDGVTVGGIPFGVSATDFTAQGDYDGDGRTDIAVWRTNGQFIWRSTATGAVTFFRLGSFGDVPVAEFNSH